METLPAEIIIGLYELLTTSPVAWTVPPLTLRAVLVYPDIVSIVTSRRASPEMTIAPSESKVEPEIVTTESSK